MASVQHSEAINHTMHIYLAGKITDAPWRMELTTFPTFRYESDVISYVFRHGCWPIYQHYLLGEYHCTGPYFIDLEPDEPQSEEYLLQLERYRHVSLFDLCRKAIVQSDVIFAWIDRDDIHGTLIELGFAHALGKPIWVASPYEIKSLWMMYEMVEYVTFEHLTVKNAFLSFIQTYIPKI